MGFEFASRRSPVLASRGIVAASQPLAAQAGLNVLMLGGNAADAAVATAAALNVTEPTSTGIGGDCFALFYEAKTRTVTALNGSGRAPAGLTIELIRSQGLASSAGEIADPFHAHTVTVPGAAAGWCDLVERHGRMPIEAVLGPAIRLAEEGFPVAPITAYFWKHGAERQLNRTPAGRALTIDGRGPKSGEIFRNPGLARTFRILAEGGQDAFYRGELAARIAKTVQSNGGVMTADDLAAHRSTWETPIHTDYRGVRIWECPPNGQGLAALIGLNVLEGFDLPALPPLGPERLHLMIEAMRLAFADARWYVADPAFSPSPLGELLSKDYARRRRALIHPDHANADLRHGAPVAGSDTVYLSVVDGEGNACSFINSNYMGFGTGLVPDGFGFTLQNRGHNFSLEPEHPNALAPGKRPYHTIIPAMATRGGDDSLYACFGVMGGFMQPQGHVQVAVAMLDDSLDPQTALDRPRFCIEDGHPDSRIAVEAGVPDSTIEALRIMGHDVYKVDGFERAIFGRGQIIRRDPETGVLWGGSDPRADGCAIGF